MAHSECEVDGASDLEALFSSREEAKPPNILATVAGFQQKAKVTRSQATNKKEKAPLLSKRSYPFLTYAFSFSS
ncbi:TPA: hypothetical protein QCR38_004731 [Bacillus cereus]|nr:hypothetical protein [Bacillus cereus]